MTGDKQTIWSIMFDVEKQLGLDEDESEDGSIDPEPTHSCANRLLIAMLSIVSFISIWIIFTEYITSPIAYLALVVAKCTVCTCFCPNFIQRSFRNIAVTPCRWARIALTGVGHIECWTHPAWPYRCWPFLPVVSKADH